MLGSIPKSISREKTIIYAAATIKADNDFDAF
jgi:hypothetical protein